VISGQSSGVRGQGSEVVKGGIGGIGVLVSGWAAAAAPDSPLAEDGKDDTWDPIEYN